MKHLLIILLFPITVQAQSFGLGHSVKFWGTSQDVINTNISYNDFSLHYFHSFDNYDKYLVTDGTYVGKQTNTFALSWTPIKYKLLYSGIVLSNRKFPIEKGTRLNFIIGVVIPIKNIAISYKHISNGFGIQNTNNVGADFISIQIKV